MVIARNDGLSNVTQRSIDATKLIRLAQYAEALESALYKFAPDKAKSTIEFTRQQYGFDNGDL